MQEIQKKNRRVFSPENFLRRSSALPKFPGELSRSSSPCGAAKAVPNGCTPDQRSVGRGCLPRCPARSCFTIRNAGDAITSEILVRSYVPEACRMGNCLIVAARSFERNAEQMERFNRTGCAGIYFHFRAVQGHWSGGSRHPISRAFIGTYQHRRLPV